MDHCKMLWKCFLISIQIIEANGTNVSILAVDHRCFFNSFEITESHPIEKTA